MNTQNYASLEACQRLVDAGIVLETEKAWFFSTTGWELVDRHDKHKVNKHYLPAPSMAEVWRELPWVTDNYGLISMNKADNVTYCGYRKGLAIREPKFESNNPTDALIDLLIFVRNEKP